jgi:hypothetical protein
MKYAVVVRLHVCKACTKEADPCVYPRPDVKSAQYQRREAGRAAVSM